MKPAAFKTPSDTQVQVVRSFHAPVESVWKSFTVPERGARWMLGPPGWSMPVCEMDFRIGGKYENRFRNEAEGTEFGWTGEFREIEPPTKIVQEESFELGDTDEAAVITITFEETGGVTTVATRIEYASKGARDAALAAGMAASMEMGYCRIDDLLTESS
ncbi:SRPBCC domain-containing protein [Stieleria maiorica]|nr:SRPBCC domain-containing protein [Stieleria maiorica]